MSVQAFFDRAVREAKRYGDDPWILLRELVQNSRDAGATHVFCSFWVKDGWTFLDFQDNGEGMDSRQVDRYLLRLYASSKEDDQSAIGFYGVGFWSTLLFEPTTIRVLTRRTQETVALEIHCQSQNIVSIDAELKHPGTRITLMRPTLNEDETLPHVLKERLTYYVGPIRPAPGRPSLEISFNGEPVLSQFEEPPHFPQKIREKDFDGILGLGPSPFVRLYKSGILVRDLTSLEEVLPNRKSRLPPGGLGLYPQISLNADRLNVLMDRQSVFEDPVLYRMVETCEQRLLTIQRDMVHQLFPMNWPNRIAHWLTQLPRQRWGWIPWLVLLCVLGYGLSRLLKPMVIHSQSLSAESVVAKAYTDSALKSWKGPSIDPTGHAPVQWQFSYEGGPPHLLFRLQALTRFHQSQGWLPGKLEPVAPYPEVDYPEGETPILVNLTTQTIAEPIALPVPPKYRLLPQSLLTLSGKKPRVMASAMGEPLVVLAEPELLTYQVIPFAEPPPMALQIAMEKSQYPSSQAAFLDSVATLPPKERALAIAGYLAEILDYSQSPQTSRLFETAEGGFLQRVLTAGGGDCDLLNGVYVLMLQTAGIPAFLSVGLVGREGKAESSMHAWVNYWADEQWITADIIAPQHYHPLRPNQVVPQALPQNLDQTTQVDPVSITGKPIKEPRPSSVPPVQRDSPLPLRPPIANSRFGFQWYWLGLLLLLPAFWLFWRWRKRVLAQPLNLDRPHYLAKLFESYFRHGTGKDPLQLKFRPLFETIQGRNLSLHQMRLLMRTQPLIAAKPNCPLVEDLPKTLPVLNREQPVLQSLAPFLPTILWLDDMEQQLKQPPLPITWAKLEAKLRQLDPEIRLYLRAGADHWRDVYLPFAHSAKGKRHLILGQNHPIFGEIESYLAKNSPEGDFHALRLILERSVFFMAQREKILVELARNLPIN